MKKRVIIIKSTSIFIGVDETYREGFVVIEGEEIVAVFDKKEQIPTSYLEQATFYDVGEQTVLPGFIESHIHVNSSALFFTGKIKFAAGSSEEECVQLLEQQVKNETLNKDEWLIAKDWYSPSWKGGKLPTKASLDARFPNVPVAMISADMHTLWVNSKGFEKLAFTEKYLVEEAENFERDPQTGEYTGVIKEAVAMTCVSGILDETVEKKAENYRLYFNHLLKMGITSVCDLAILADEEQTKIDDQIYPEVYQYLEKQGKLDIRAHLFPLMQDTTTRIEAWKKKYATERLRIAGGKYFFDGVISTHTAYMKAAYENEPGEAGLPMIPEEDIRKKVMLAASKDLPLRIHTIGDRAISLAIDYFLEANETYGELKNGFHCLEHLEIIDPVDIPRLKTSGLVASVQPSHCLMDYLTIKQDVGEERETRMWPFGTFLDYDVPLAFGTDSPVVIDVTPLENVYYAVTRQTKDEKPAGGWLPTERITVEEALLAHTKDASKACSFSEKIGTLESGKYADLVVLDRNIEAISPQDLLQAEVAMTFLNGELKYSQQ